MESNPGLFSNLTPPLSSQFGAFLRAIAIAVCLYLGDLTGATRTGEGAALAAKTWMAQHPLIKNAGLELGEFLVFPEKAAYQLHIFRLIPAGYVVLHSDDRLPLLVAFSADSPISLEDVPGNAFRAFLENIAAAGALEVERRNAGVPPPEENQAADAREATYPAGDFVVGPLMGSSWNQNDPYNLNAPVDTTGTAGSSYGGRVPIGCVPLAFSQLLYFHRWPLSGNGASSYSDTAGSITGVHAASYADPYDWENMLDAHSPADPQAKREAVGELAYELAVAVEADFEADGTSSSTSTMRSKLGDHYRFEPSVYHSSYATLQESLDSDILAGYPAIVSIPGHAVVADGLLRNGTDLQYHINYGWGGTNNGWFAYNAIPAGATIEDGVTSLRPVHIPVPRQTSVSLDYGQSCDLLWTLPKRRNGEVDHIRIVKQATRANPWTIPCETIESPSSSGWIVTSDGYSGSGWFAGPSGTAEMDLVPVFIPDANTSFEFRIKYRLAGNAFRVCVSTDGGSSFNEQQRWTNSYPLDWAKATVPLGAYSGQEILLRLELLNGSYYSSGGIWVDELEVATGSRKVWETLMENPSQQILEFSKTSSLWEDCASLNLFRSTSTSTDKDWVLSSVTGVGGVFYKEPGGYGNREYHLTSQQPLSVPSAQTRLSLRMKNHLASDLFRVRASTNGSFFVTIAEVAGSGDWRDYTVDLSAYAGMSIYVRLEYVVGSFYGDGGVWIDSISVEELTHPQYEQQPLHQTTLTGLSAGSHTVAGQVVRVDGATTPIGPPLSLTVNAPLEYRVEFVLGGHGVRTGGGALVQMVVPGGSAALPSVDENPGWLLTGWSSSHENVQSDLILTAVYQELLAARGTPHWWLISHGLATPDATSVELDAAELSDPTGKGNNAAFDYVAGTDPNASSDRLKFTQFSAGSTGISLRWTGVLGRWYRILRSTTLAPGSWSPVMTVQCTVDGEELTVTTSSEGTAGFFCISVGLEEP